jgi:hypothetical protein
MSTARRALRRRAVELHVQAHLLGDLFADVSTGLSEVIGS